MSKIFNRRTALVSLFSVGAAAVSGPFVPWTAGAYDRASGSGQRAPLQEAALRVPRAEARFGAVPIAADDIVMGALEAPVTIIKYGSLTCPHCAAFHVNTTRRLKSDYVETGKVRYVHRDFPLDQVALAAAVLVRCVGNDRARAFAILDMLYTRQMQWRQAPDPLAALGTISVLSGVGEGAYKECREDQALVDRILQQRQQGVERYGVNATPTLLINGDRFSGNLSFAQVAAIVKTAA